MNYSEASRRLHVAQPAISQTILDLEKEMGVKLLLRTNRSVQLAAGGSIFLREAEDILRRAGEARRLAQRAARGEVGSLGMIANGEDSICKFIRKLGSPEHLRACYEAGPTGFVLYWQLTQLGVKCDVVAPSLVPKKPGIG